jgi:hypothetical protein
MACFKFSGTRSIAFVPVSGNREGWKPKTAGLHKTARRIGQPGPGLDHGSARANEQKIRMRQATRCLIGRNIRGSTRA